MDKFRKLELIQRSLGLRHKLKVHESMKQPDNHEDISISLLTRWEYEDELRAIEEILAEQRQRNVTRKRAILENGSGDDDTAEITVSATNQMISDNIGNMDGDDDSEVPPTHRVSATPKRKSKK